MLGGDGANCVTYSKYGTAVGETFGGSARVALFNNATVLLWWDQKPVILFFGTLGARRKAGVH